MFIPTEMDRAECGKGQNCIWGTSPEVEKVWQPGNLVARKILKNEALAESFWILLLHFLTSKQFGESVKENGNIFDSYKIGL